MTEAMDVAPSADDDADAVALLRRGADATHPSVMHALRRVDPPFRHTLQELGLLYDAAARVRFLIAAKLDRDAALSLAASVHRWRSQALPLQLSEHVMAEVRKQKVAYAECADRRTGNPLVVVRSSRYDPRTRDLDASVLATVHALETALGERLLRSARLQPGR